MSDLKHNLANLIGVSSEEIALEPLTAGLTHKSYSCHIGTQRIFVKDYSAMEDCAGPVRQINQLATYMLDRGIPAPEVAFYSPDFPNIVVHTFVEGEMHAGDFSEIGAIAKLYSRVAMLGTEHRTEPSKAEYLSGIREVLDRIDRLDGSDILVDTSIQAGMQAIGDSIFTFLQSEIEHETLLHVPMHDDFCEKNILLDGQEVKLLCDWDSYRQKYLNEHLACTAARFSTERPLMGEMQQDKLDCFLRSLGPELLELIPDPEQFAQLFPYLATMKHLRTYIFRNLRVKLERNDLRTPLLKWPLYHCQQLINNRQQVSEWVYGVVGPG